MADDPGNVFGDAARFLVDVVTAINDDAWERPGLGAWTVRDLAGHASRALLTVETYLHRGAEQEDVTSPEAYFAVVKKGAVDPSAIAQRGREAGAALGPDLATAVGEIAERVTGLVREATGDELVATAAGGMRLRTYLPTRTFELVVHGLDLERATGVSVPVPANALDASVLLAVGVAGELGTGIEVLQALTGRVPLSATYSITP